MADSIREIMSMDPFSIKKQLVDLIDKNLGVKNPDTYEAGFLGYLTQAQTLLTSDVLFNNSMAYNEAFTHLLTLPTSLQNHANMLDYKLSSATPCEGYVTMYIPLPDSSNGVYQITLKNGTICKGTIPYLVKHTYIITSTQNKPKVQMRNSETGYVTDVELNIEIRDGTKYLTFNAAIWQVKIFEFTETFTDVVYKEFYDINIGGISDQYHSINIGVYQQDDNFADPRLVKFNEVASIYSAGSKDKVFTFKYYGDGRATVRFGNGVFGMQPKENSKCDIIVFSTMGSAGKVYPGQIQVEENLIDFNTNSSIKVYGLNYSTIDSGTDEEDIEVAKANIIAQTSSARRLVTQDDYKGFSGITGIKNLELFPMLLRRDTNVNEIDIFSVLYDTVGYPIPTTNLNYIIDRDRKVLSKEHVYKLAIKTGENGVELVPNTLKILNHSAVDPHKHELYSAIYIDEKYDNYDPIYVNYNGKIIFTYSDNIQNYVEPDEIKEFVSPFNIAIEERGTNKVGVFEYVPYTLTEVPQVEDSVDYIDIEMSLTAALFDYIPTESMRFDNIKPTHINALHELSISSNVAGELVKAYVIIEQEGRNEPLRYTCQHKYFSAEDNNLQTTCMIPVTDLFEGEVLYKLVVYYGDKYYNTYKKYLIFKNGFDLSLSTQYIGYPISFGYDPSDPRTMQSAPAIDKVYVGITNVKIQWSNWKDVFGFNVDGYLVDVELNKLSIVDINKIKCEFSIGYGNDTYEVDSIASSNDTAVTYRFKIPYNPQYILDGSTYYKVQILYKFNTNEGDPGVTYSPFASYSGFAIFRRRFSELMWCNIESANNYTDNQYKIYRIPVIEKTYYENNKEYLENRIFNQLALLDSKTIDYKMLTDRMNFKFAKTVGTTENLKYNDRVANIDKSLVYNGWTCDLPPTIRLGILVNKNSQKTKTEIINECKQVTISFMLLRANFNGKFIRSELARFIHDTIPDIISCEVLEPTRDIIYYFDQNDLPRDKDTVLSFNPEFIWFDINKIHVETTIAPV